MLQVALVGSGGFAKEHAAALQRQEGVSIKYVVGSNRRRLQDFLSHTPGSEATTDFNDVLNDPSVEAVDICNRTAQHAPMAIAAALAGKHVHVDKPATLSVEAFDEMVAAARSTNVTLTVGQTVRFQPIIERLKSSIDGNEIGAPKLLHVSWYTGHTWPSAWRGWQMDSEQSGGHPVHNGSHIMDLATWLMGSAPVEVMTRGFNSFATEMPIPDSFSMITRFANGGLATLELSYALTRRGDSHRRIVVAGQTGTIFHDTADDTELSSQTTLPAPPSTVGALDSQLKHWIGRARGTEEPIINLHEVRASLAAVIAAQKSLVTGNPVPILENGEFS